MKITISCSIKHRELIRETIVKLSKLGLTPLFPNLDYDNENTDKADTPAEMKHLAMEHYEAIDEADAVYFITPNGYMGTSCKLELGYAIARQKPIYFSEPTKDPALDCYVRGFVDASSLEDFLKMANK